MLDTFSHESSTFDNDHYVVSREIELRIDLLGTGIYIFFNQGIEIRIRIEKRAADCVVWPGITHIKIISGAVVFCGYFQTHKPWWSEAGGVGSHNADSSWTNGEGTLFISKWHRQQTINSGVTYGGVNHYTRASAQFQTIAIPSKVSEVATCEERAARVPANTRHSPNAGLLLGQRRRRWANIKPALDKLLAFAGVALREINVDTLVSTLTRRDRHLRDRLDTLRHKDISLTDPRRISEVWTRDPYMTVVAVRRSTNATRLLFWKWLLVAWRFTTTLHSSKQKVMWRSVVCPFEVFAHKIRLRRLIWNAKMRLQTFRFFPNCREYNTIKLVCLLFACVEIEEITWINVMLIEVRLFKVFDIIIYRMFTLDKISIRKMIR